MEGKSARYWYDTAMDSTFSRPKLRWPIDIRLHDIPQGASPVGAAAERQVLVLQCPLGVAEQPLYLLPAAGQVISLFQGELTYEEIVARCAPLGLREETLRELITLLDEHLFLANARFFAAEREKREGYGSLSVRPAALAGLSYPGAARELGVLVDSFLAPHHAPPAMGELVCLVAPHIDYRRGGVSYGEIYPHLREPRVDTFILMGTAHQYSRHMYHLSAKDFESPLGRLSCDLEFVTKLANRYGSSRAFADEFLHKREHSLELQLPFLSRVSPGSSIVPILVGSLHEAVSSGRSPREFDEYESFVGSLVESIREATRSGKRVCFIAGVDMAHVGSFFGDPWELTPERMAHVAERDARYLEAIAAHDLNRLFSHIAEDGDARRICGFPTMYTILDTLSRLGIRARCQTRRYHQAVDYPSGCAVTFAGMALERPYVGNMPS